MFNPSLDLNRNDTPQTTKITDYRPEIEAKTYITLLPQGHPNLPPGQ